MFFIYFIQQWSLLQEWLYTAEKTKGLWARRSNSSCPCGSQSHEAIQLPQVCQPMPGLTDLCCYFILPSFQIDRGIHFWWNGLFHLMISRILVSASSLLKWEFSGAGNVLVSWKSQGAKRMEFPQITKWSSVFLSIPYSLFWCIRAEQVGSYRAHHQVKTP